MTAPGLCFFSFHSIILSVINLIETKKVRTILNIGLYLIIKKT